MDSMEPYLLGLTYALAFWLGCTALMMRIFWIRDKSTSFKSKCFGCFLVLIVWPYLLKKMSTVSATG